MGIRREKQPMWTRRRFLRGGVGIVALPVLAGCTVLDARDDDRSEVDILPGRRFEPAGVTIKLGETIAWNNKDIHPHTVTCNPDVSPRSQLPENAQPFDSGDLLTGDIWAFTPTVAGTYVYVCRHHDGEGMIGTIEVDA